MKRDYSKFLPSDTKTVNIKSTLSPLETLGWQQFFAQQISVESLSETPPVRIAEVHRNVIHILGDGIDQMIPPCARATVGDWLLFDHQNPQNSEILERKSVLKRRAPGTDRTTQLIAANIDTVFIVTSCNPDFNIARLERYIALVLDAEITPVIVITKADIAETPQEYVEQARAISELATVVLLTSHGDEPKLKLSEWCKAGKTVAFIGSSGVGKSTLTNSLTGSRSIETQGIREDDAKGRHTTTTRQLHIVKDGCLIVDTPGMRELQMTDTAQGIEHLFADIEELSTQCRFNDCAHETEPGCAVLNAIEVGDVDVARFTRWRKLKAEDAFNSASLLERKSKDKKLGKLIRDVQKQKKR